MGEILLTWWGALDRGGPTVGDALSVANTEQTLRSAGLSYTLASDIELECFTAKTVNWREIDPRRFDCLLFVCGPVIGGSESFRHLVARFEHCIKIAAGVSILPNYSPDHWNPFDYVLARDGLTKSYFDLSLAFPEKVTVDLANISSRNKPLKIGLCLRGKQREYGEQNCLHREADIITRSVIQKIGASSLELNTRLDHRGATFTQFFSKLQSCDVVLTTRLHGLLFSLLSGTPLIALDQIRGGGKVLAVAQTVRWPHAFPVEDATSSMLETALNDVLSDRGLRDVTTARNRAIDMSASALQRFISIVLKHSRGQCG